MNSITQIYKSEASLLDSVEAIQDQLDNLHYSNKVDYYLFSVLTIVTSESFKEITFFLPSRQNLFLGT